MSWRVTTWKFGEANDPCGVESFRLLTEDGDPILTESGDNIVVED